MTLFPHLAVLQTRELMFKGSSSCSSCERSFTRHTRWTVGLFANKLREVRILPVDFPRERRWSKSKNIANNCILSKKRVRFIEDWEFILAGQKNDLKLQTKIWRCWNEWLLEGCIILPAIQRQCKAWKFRQNIEKGEKGREKKWGRGGGREKKGSAPLFEHKPLFLSFMPSVEGKPGAQRGGRGDEDSSALHWGPLQDTRTPREPLAGGAGHSWEAKAILGFFLPSPHFLPPLRNFPGWTETELGFEQCSSADFWQNRFSGQNIDLLTLRCFNLQCSCFPTAHLLVSSGTSTPWAALPGTRDSAIGVLPTKVLGLCYS